MTEKRKSWYSVILIFALFCGTIYTVDETATVKIHIMKQEREVSCKERENVWKGK